MLSESLENIARLADFAYYDPDDHDFEIVGFCDNFLDDDENQDVLFFSDFIDEFEEHNPRCYGKITSDNSSWTLDWGSTVYVSTATTSYGWQYYKWYGTTDNK